MHDRLGARSSLIRACRSALSLFDPKTGALFTTASAGAGNNHLERFVASLDDASFPARVAASDDGTAVMDAVAADLQVDEPLRSSGIRSLLGIKLPPHRKLLGVLYVGIAESRAFTARERRRLESLGNWLTLHLDNARLYAD